MLLRSSPAVHKAELMKPLYRKPEFCSACHKFFVDEAVNGHGFFRLQNTFEEWKNSVYGDPKNKEHKRCQDCHMPLVESSDPAAKPYVEQGKVVFKIRSHRFPGSNTARPFLDSLVGDEEQRQMAREQLEVTEKFLKSDVVALTIEAPAALAPGQTAPIKVTVFNKGVGHRFPTGTVDTHDCWVELVVSDARGGKLYHSGELLPSGEVDPDAHKFISKAVDEDGNWLYRRDMWNIAGFEYAVTIFPKNFNTKVYRVAIPAGTRGPVTVVGRLNFRKYNQKFTDFVFGRGPFRDEAEYTGPHPKGIRLPITVISESKAQIAIGERGS
jgi:hypothetical protein